MRAFSFASIMAAYMKCLPKFNVTGLEEDQNESVAVFDWEEGLRSGTTDWLWKVSAISNVSACETSTGRRGPEEEHNDEKVVSSVLQSD